MNLRQFLDLKYQGKAYALTAKEAKYLGIDYPLISGWIGRHGDRQLSEEEILCLRDMAINRAIKDQKNRKKRRMVEKAFGYARNVDLFVNGGSK